MKQMSLNTRNGIAEKGHVARRSPRELNDGTFRLLAVPQRWFFHLPVNLLDSSVVQSSQRLPLYNSKRQSISRCLSDHFKDPSG